MSDNSGRQDRFYKKAVNGRDGNVFTRLEELEDKVRKLIGRNATTIVSQLIQQNREIILSSVSGGTTDPTADDFTGVVISPSGQVIDGVLYNFALVEDGVVLTGLGQDINNITNTTVVNNNVGAGVRTLLYFTEMDGGAFIEDLSLDENSGTQSLIDDLQLLVDDDWAPIPTLETFTSHRFDTSLLPEGSFVFMLRLQGSDEGLRVRSHITITAEGVDTNTETLLDEFSSQPFTLGTSVVNHYISSPNKLSSLVLDDAVRLIVTVQVALVEDFTPTPQVTFHYGSIEYPSCMIVPMPARPLGMLYGFNKVFMEGTPGAGNMPVFRERTDSLVEVQNLPGDDFEAQFANRAAITYYFSQEESTFVAGCRILTPNLSDLPLLESLLASFVTGVPSLLGQFVIPKELISSLYIAGGYTSAKLRLKSTVATSAYVTVSLRTIDSLGSLSAPFATSTGYFSQQALPLNIPTAYQEFSFQFGAGEYSVNTVLPSDETICVTIELTTDVDCDVELYLDRDTPSYIDLLVHKKFSSADFYDLRFAHPYYLSDVASSDGFSLERSWADVESAIYTASIPDDGTPTELASFTLEGTVLEPYIPSAGGFFILFLDAEDDPAPFDITVALTYTDGVSSESRTVFVPAVIIDEGVTRVEINSILYDPRVFDYLLSADGTWIVTARIYASTTQQTQNLKLYVGFEETPSLLALPLDLSKPGSGAVDAADVTYTPADNTDWDGDVDPGDVNDALDQLAARATVLESAGAGMTATEVEIDLGSDLVWRGRFTITDAAISATKKLMVWVAPGPYTGKGTLADEAELTPIQILYVVPASGSAQVTWETKPEYGFEFDLSSGARSTSTNDIGALKKLHPVRRNKVRGNVKFFYTIMD